MFSGRYPFSDSGDTRSLWVQIWNIIGNNRKYCRIPMNISNYFQEKM